MCNSAQFKNNSTYYTKSDLITKISVLFSVVSDENGILLKKRLHMMNEIIGYSYSSALMTSIKLCGTLQAYTYIYIFFF